MSSCRILVLAAIVTAAAFFGSICGLAVWASYPEVLDWGDQAGQSALDYLRCRLEERDCRVEPRSPAFMSRGPRTIFATWYQDGVPARTVVGEGLTAVEALEAAGDALVETFRNGSADPVMVHLRVEFLTARGPIIQFIPLLFSLSVVPGLDGLGLHQGDRAAYLLPHELQQAGLLTDFRPFSFMDLRFGIDGPPLVRSLERELGCERGAGTLFRFRTESYIEREPGVAVALYRNAPPAPPVTRQTVEEAIGAAADWVVAAQLPDGRFHYQYDPLQDRYLDDEYSLSRHAGTTLFLLQVAGHTAVQRYRETAERALDVLWEHSTRRCGRLGATCVGRGPAVGIGPTALALAAFVEHHLLSGSGSLERARELGAFLLMMQRPDGNFYHRYDFSGDIDQQVQSFYQTGEAAYALARLAAADPEEPAWREAVRRTLEYWVEDYWSHFAGGFFFVEEHWTCLAIEAAHPLFQDPRYDRFCLDIAHFLARLLHDESSSPFADYVGGAGFGPFFPPHTTPTATRVEAMVAAYRLSAIGGDPDAELARAIRLAYGFLLAAQYRDVHEPLLENLGRARGGFRESPLLPTVRIDYNQHAGSALLRGLGWIL